jgi:hypothetical protein
MEDLQDLIVMNAGVTAHEGTTARSSFYLLAVPASQAQRGAAPAFGRNGAIQPGPPKSLRAFVASSSYSDSADPADESHLANPAARQT